MIDSDLLDVLITWDQTGHTKSPSSTATAST